jgi:hypothetical protein
VVVEVVELDLEDGLVVEEEVVLSVPSLTESYQDTLSSLVVAEVVVVPLCLSVEMEPLLLVRSMLTMDQLESTMELKEIPRPVVMVEAVVQVVLESLVVVLDHLATTVAVVELVEVVELQDMTPIVPR